MYGAERAKKPLSPVMRQFADAKAAHPDAILFFRMGDFYEMFHDDAVVAASALDLTLTSRNKGAADEIPMAGVPHHAAAGYLTKLLSLGHKVAICEQMADPSKTRGIVPRAVVRVLTPGLVTDTDQLDGKSNHFLCAVDRPTAALSIGVAVLDLSTGELSAATLDDEPGLWGELAKLDPRELLVGSLPEETCSLARKLLPRAAVRKDAPLAKDTIDESIGNVLGEAEWRAARATLELPACQAIARVLRFAKECNPGVALPVRRLLVWDPQATMRLDEVTQTHLELVRAVDGQRTGSLLSILDETCTSPGARMLRRWLLAPLLDVSLIRRRLDAVEALVQNPLARSEARERLRRVGDLERLATRAALGEATPRDFGSMREGLAAAPEVLCALAKIPDVAAREALGLETGPPDVVAEVAARLQSALVDRPPPLLRDGGVFRAGYDSQLDQTRGAREEGAALVAEFESKLRESSAIPTLKVRYTRVFGYYIEVTRAHAAKVPASFRRKQTVAGGERYTCEELSELEDRILHAEERYVQREQELYSALLSEVGAQVDRLRELAGRIAEWDVFAALAEVAHRRDYVRPTVDGGDVLEIVEGRHPVVEELAAAGKFVPNDVCLDRAEARLWIITGPNMAGKSTLMRQVALSVILAQTGSYVPAKSARIGVVDRVFSRVGASDNVARGESTFMVEMRETAAILRKATARSFVILDEIGRGTSTYDGVSIAWAVAEYLHDVVGCRAMFATHYHELTELSESAAHAANYSVSARELGDDVVFFHKLTKGAANRSYGVAVAKLAGLPESVVARAKALLAGLENGGTLPSGRPSSLRSRNKAGNTQLDLFVPVDARKPSGAGDALIELLASVEVDRLTPLEALQLVAKMKTRCT